MEDNTAVRLKCQIGHAKELGHLAKKLNALIREENWDELERVIEERAAIIEKMKEVSDPVLSENTECAKELWEELGELLREAFFQDRATKELLDEKVTKAAQEAEESGKGRSLVQTYRGRRKKDPGTWLDMSK